MLVPRRSLYPKFREDPKSRSHEGGSYKGSFKGSLKGSIGVWGLLSFLGFESRSLKGAPIKYLLVVGVPKLAGGLGKDCDLGSLKGFGVYLNLPKPQGFGR